ncbi:MAG: hypothetical protein AAFR36_32275 [Bacteroidota bacterium]
MAKSGRSRRSAAQMYPLVELYQSSNVSPKVFCESEGIPVSALMYWQKKYRASHLAQGSASSGFVPVEVVESSSSSPVLELVLPSGARLVFRDYPERSYLQCLLASVAC